MSFLSKVRVITLGAAHDLLDKTIDLDSPSALRQYVRDLEDALDKLKNEAAVQAGLLRTLKREQGDLDARIATGTTLAAKYVTTNPDLARAKASDVIQAKKERENNISQYASQMTVSQKLDIAVSQLDTKHTEMVNRVRDLERLDRTTKAQEQAAGTFAAAGKVLSGGADISIDDIESKMRARGDVASEKFDRAMGSVNVEEDSEHKQAVDDLLASLTPSTPKGASAA